MHPSRWLLLVWLLGSSPAAAVASGPETAGSAGRHWTFQSVTTPVVPRPQDTRWARNPVDQFIRTRLEAEGLRPAPEAEPLTWLRRAYLDLTGIPPSPAQVEAFLADPSGSAYDRVVDQLLDSPRHGERWAQHWLDVVRYADTHGFEVNTERPNAWPYRDYVIRAVNQDTPYDRFIREQLAGDALGEDAATGFLITASVLLPGQIGKDEPSIRLARQDALDEIVVNTGQTFLGLSIGCARCHDHKFDPISQRDYYAMQSFFAGVEYEERELHSPEAEFRRAEVKQVRAQISAIERQMTRHVPRAKSGTERVAVNGRLNVDRFPPVTAKRVRFTIRETNSLEPCLDELEVFDTEDNNIAASGAGTVATSSGDTVVAGRHELRHINDGRYGNGRSWMSSEKSKGWVILEFPESHRIDRVLWGRDREGQYDDRLATRYVVEVADESGDWKVVADSEDRVKYLAGMNASNPFAPAELNEDDSRELARLGREKAAREATLKSLSSGLTAFAGVFRAPDSIHRLNRGDPEQPREEVAPAVPAILSDRSLPLNAPEQERRQVLAEWISSPENPLTARVMVNRIWQGHFGTGLVETASDFGRNGSPPSHPELLDWLASEFIRSGWSVKHVHRLIVLSATYRQSARVDPLAQARDAGDRLLWRYPSRRLEAETIRDCMLAVSGRMNAAMFGRGFDLFDQRGGLSGFKPVETFGAEGLRRMIYAHKVRRERDAVFGAFDCPDAGQSTARRRDSTTPIQALNLFNSRFTLDESEAMAGRVQAEAGPEPTAGIRRAYVLALARDPSPTELAEVEPTVREHGLAVLCRALFNSNEFLFLP